MELKEKLENELNFLKSKGHERSDIEEKLGYSENYLDQALSRPTEKVYRSILLYKEWVLCNTIQQKTGVMKLTPEIEKKYEERFDRLMSSAAKHTDTFNMIAEAHLLMTKASLGVPVVTSLVSQGTKPGSVDATEQMLGISNTDSQKSKRKQKDT